MTTASKYPKHLDACGRRVWRRLCTELEQTGPLGEVDKLHVEMVCQLVSRLRKAGQGIADFGAIIATRQSPIPKRSPYAAEANACMSQLRPLLARLRRGPPRRPAPGRKTRSA
jgi:P27 family predicted phage terminase small subunit